MNIFRWNNFFSIWLSY